MSDDDDSNIYEFKSNNSKIIKDNIKVSALDSNLLQSYFNTKILFLESIQDPYQLEHANTYLRSAFLEALNPLKEIDDYIEECLDLHEGEE